MNHCYRLGSSLAGLEPKRAWAEIDLAALRQNYRILLRRLSMQSPKASLIAVVKAEAYGHGAPACVLALLEEGCDFFAVSSLDEALAVRSICDERRIDAKILILGYTDVNLAQELATFRLTQALISYEYAKSLQEAARRAGVLLHTHIALDTGMNRLGFAGCGSEELACSADRIAQVSLFSNLLIDGMFTHFACADDAPFFTALQSNRYAALRRLLEERGVRIPFHHACNSTATFCRAEDHLDGVRIGILLYGVGGNLARELSLSPILRLKSLIAHLHRLLPGETLGYGGEFCAKDERMIATLPVGYADGFLRAYTGAKVEIHTASGDFLAPVVGRVCMDQLMLDVTEVPASIGNEVTLLGSPSTPLDALAERANTIAYESLCLIGARVPRHYIGMELCGDFG